MNTLNTYSTCRPLTQQHKGCGGRAHTRASDTRQACVRLASGRRWRAQPRRPSCRPAPRGTWRPAARAATSISATSRRVGTPSARQQTSCDSDVGEQRACAVCIESEDSNPEIASDLLHGGFGDGTESLQPSGWWSRRAASGTRRRARAPRARARSRLGLTSPRTSYRGG